MKNAQRLMLQRLEPREVPATFGIPWTDPRHLTVSLAPDNSTVTTGKSVLFQTLNSQQPTVIWQREILRALQSWASVANIDVGFVTDTGVSFGSGSGQGLARATGDIRVGSVPLSSSAFAIGLPPDPFFGDYWSGEVIYNSINQLNPTQATLYSVFVHEFGHALGLPSNSDSISVMFNQATTPADGLTGIDIAAIQALYGLRQPDQHDADESNGTFGTATGVEYQGLPPGATTYTGQYPLVAFGDMTTHSDVDIFDIETPVNYSGPVTFQLRSRGLSLLAPKLSVYNEWGQLLGSSLSTDPAGDIVTVHINQSIPDAHYFLKVEGATDDVFGIGRFGIAVTFDANVQSIYLDRLAGILTGPYDELDEDDLSELMLNPTQAKFNDDYGSDDDLPTAIPLASVAKLFETIGTIETAADVDNFKVRTPQQSGPVILTMSVRAEAVNGTVPRVELFSASGQVLAAQVLFNGDGRLTIQSGQLTADTDYFVRLRPNVANQLGNYSLMVLAGSTTTSPQTFVAGTVGFQPSALSLTVVQNQVFHFLLEVAGPATSAIRMTIENMNGLVYDVTVYGGTTGNARPVLLVPGSYVIRFTSIGAVGAGLGYTLRGAVLSDPIGPGAIDTTQNPAGPGGGWATYYFSKLRRFGDGLVRKIV